MEFAGNAVVSAFGGKLGETLPLNKNEHAELNIFLPTSDTFSLMGTILNAASAGLGLVPQFDAHGTPIGVGVATGFGGVQLSKFAKYGADGAEMIAKAFQGSADRASKMGGYYRRAEDYVLQANLATSELKQFGRQVITSLIHEQIAKKEYQNQLVQIENSEAIQEYMNEKFTQEELYLWMQGELSRIFFDSYKFAFDTAKRAEATMQHELMRPEFDDLNLIKFGYWDGGRRGLLSGETLFLDLKRLEMAYHDQNRREYELTKHVSISRLDPMALLKLKATGKCEVEVPEWLYDMDSPGQYMRRIKSVAISIPCIVGPYTGVHCKVSLLKSSIRTSSLLGEGYARSEDGDDIRFRDFTGAIQSVITSTAQNDSGLFETNLRDDRYLPFEGAGAISKWRLELPNDVPQFDFESISDVILHVRYTAREAGNLRSEASKFVQEEVLAGDDGLQQLFTLNYDYGAAWHQFVTAANDTVRTLDLKVTKDQLPYWARTVTMGTEPEAMFCRIDLAQNKLTVAPVKLAFIGDEVNGWTLHIDSGTQGLFTFLKNNMANRVYMAVNYWAD
jgi:Tc toxin complex TcA C-terminal TcB-binding domain